MVNSYALVLLITSALIHATWNLVAKRSGGSTLFAFQTAVAIGVLWTPISICFIWSAPSSSPLNWSGAAWLTVGASAAIHALYFVTLLHGYKVAPLSIVYPVARGTGPLISASLAIILLHEALSASTAIGILIIALGVVLLSLQGDLSSIDRAVINRGILWGSLTGISIALYSLVDAYAVKTLGLHPVLYDYVGTLLRAGLLLPLVLTAPAVWPPSREVRRAVLIVALCSPLAYILVLYALQIAPLSRVAPARELSLIFGALFGGKLLEEGQMLKRMTAAALIAGGVAMVSA